MDIYDVVLIAGARGQRRVAQEEQRERQPVNSHVPMRRHILFAEIVDAIAISGQTIVDESHQSTHTTVTLIRNVMRYQNVH